MRHLTPHQLSLLQHYAQELGQLGTYQLIEEGKVSSKAEASAITSFMIEVLDLAFRYEKNKKVVFGEAAYHGDIIKLQLIVDELLEERGFAESEQ